MKRTVLAPAVVATTVTLSCGAALAVTLNGGPGPDALHGTHERGRIDGNGGSDSILGLGAADLLVGDTGNDAVAGASGDDNLKGGSGADSLSGGSGDDAIDGGFAEDDLRGGAGADEIRSQDLDAGASAIGTSWTAGRAHVTADFEDRVASNCVSVVVGGF
jgi:Ca2+-binding RTX toxin-like protein